MTATPAFTDADLVAPPDLRRQQILVKAHPVDNAGKLTATYDPQFDLSRTIFKTLPSGIKQLFQRTKLDTKLQFSDSAIADISAAYAALGPPKHLADDAPIHKFMLEHCDFSCEHADGSFLDHLIFCREYAARHYTQAAGAPRVMLLHSIMGVGTNCFPMTIDKLPTLAKLCAPYELAQIEAFPSVLRLLVHGPLLQELSACPAEKLVNIGKLTLHRLLDNAPVELSGKQLFEQLNYQLIHAIDFLPAAAWQRTSNEYFFGIFVTLHEVLTRAGQLHAKVDWDPSWMQPMTAGARPETWRHWLVDLVPNVAIQFMASKQIARFSAAVGHSLEYRLEYGGPAMSRM